MKTKSKLFSYFDVQSDDNKQFALHLSQLLSLSDEAMTTLVQSYRPVKETRTRSEEWMVVDKVVGKIGITHTEFMILYNVMDFLIRQMVDHLLEGDDPLIWPQDLQTLGVINEDGRKKLERLLSSIQDDVLPWYRRYRSERRELQVLPRLATADTTVELRGVLRETYTWGTPIEEFSPEIIDVVPVISVKIGLRGVSNESTYVHFQGKPEEIDYLIAELQAAKKAAQSLSDRYLQS